MTKAIRTRSARKTARMIKERDIRRGLRRLAMESAETATDSVAIAAAQFAPVPALSAVGI